MRLLLTLFYFIMFEYRPYNADHASGASDKRADYHEYRVCAKPAVDQSAEKQKNDD
jgi:hypothetical protein